MPVQYNGVTYPILSQDKLNLGEIAAVEKVTGLNLAKIRRMGETCVCGHGPKEHLRLVDEVIQPDTSCTVCADCERHEADLPTVVTSAFIWVSVKRGEPTVRFSDIEAAEDLFDVPEAAPEPEAEPEVEPDPTGAAQPEESPI